MIANQALFQREPFVCHKSQTWVADVLDPLVLGAIYAMLEKFA